MSHLIPLTLSCLLSLHMQLAGGLNLDPISPTVVSSSLTDSSSGFGWTLTQHTSSNGRKSVLVSAPKADGEGGVYSCPFDVQGTCQFQGLFQNKIVNKDINPFLGDLNSDPRAFEGQLLGYSLKSSGDVVMACAPLYVQASLRVTVEDREYFTGAPNGRCIILNSDLNTTAQVYADNSRLPTLLLAGLDLEILGDIGSQRFALSNTFFGESPHGGQLILSVGVSGEDITDDQRTVTTQVPVDSLYGFHLEAGQFTQLNTPEIVVSSPRASSHFGQLEILSSDNLASGTLVTLTGDEADGYYGYDFAVLDLGQGGYGSLVVGCPLCDGENGRVYVYTHTGDPNNPFVESTISAPSAVGGRFGLAVENVGDIDLDGLSDVAVSAPYEGEGVVYIYRGSETGLVVDDYQMLTALDDQEVTRFGYSLSGGLDIDNNGYPDLTVGDLGGRQVTTFRASPLVNVTLELADRKETLDVTGSSDRLCEVDGVLLQCFNVTPCFNFEPIEGNVEQIGLEYFLEVDKGSTRVSTYSISPEGVPTLGGSTFLGSINITVNVTTCAPAVTFVLDANFVDTDSILVSLSVDNAPKLLELEEDEALAQFGRPLHPMVMRYIRGDTLAPLSLEYEISSNVNCSFGDPDVCEGEFSIGISAIMSQAQGADGTLLLASSNEFGYQLNVTNTAEDTAVNPILIIELPQQTRLSRTDPTLTCNTRTEVSSNVTFVECTLKNPMSSQETFDLSAYFFFNDTTSLLSSGSLQITFSVRDGGTQIVSTPSSTSFGLQAVSDYELAARISETDYRALRTAVAFTNTSLLSLEQVGPQVTLSVFAQNSRNTTTGTAFPRSTLYIHVPTDLVRSEREGQEVGPLLIPFDVVVNDLGSGVNCSQYEAVPKNLSVSQQPGSFLPPWLGPSPPTSPICERNGTIKCGTIICTIFDLRPVPSPPTIITLFARLFSPTIADETENVVIYSEIVSETELPTIGEDSNQTSLVSFSLSPGAKEVQRNCINYWVVVVSVVVGISAVVFIIIVLAMCGVFRRWHKYRQEDNLEGFEQTDQELSFQRRTIPPLPHLTNGAPSSPLPAPEDGIKQDLSLAAWEKDKEAEAEAEAEFDQDILDSPTSITFDPSELDTLGEGLETDL